MFGNRSFFSRTIINNIWEMTMVDKMNSISHNHIWELIELLV
jgi:hypothetical protein